MKITVICVGKIKEDFYRKAVSEYEKRLGRYCRLEIIEVQDESAPESAGSALKEQIKEKEAARIFRHIRKDALLITLEIQGSSPDSLTFARELQQWEVQGNSSLQFVIGGSFGLHHSVSKAADWSLSFSNMTFPHQLMRVILLEQIYRAYRIIRGEPYHK